MSISIIKEKIGSLGINKDDIVQIAERAKLWPIEHRKFACTGYGGNFMSEVQTNPFTINANRVNKLLFNKQTLERIILTPIIYDTVTIKGLVISLLDQLNNFKSSFVILDDTTTLSNPNYFLSYLSNGNILIVYTSGADTSFIIFDRYLNIVNTDTISNGSTVEAAIPLSGGGFAVLTLDSTDLYLNIYSNTGTVVLSSTQINTTGVTSCNLAQLSDGNIVIALAKGTANPVLSIYTSAGVLSLASLTVIGLNGGDNPKLSFSTMNNYFCCLLETDGNTSAAVYSNAGAARNFNMGFIFNGGIARIARNATVVNDGTRFWVLAGILAAGGIFTDFFKVVSLPTDNNNVNNRTFTLPYSILKVPTYPVDSPLNITDVSAFCKNGVICFSYENNIIRFDVTNNIIEDVATIGNNNFFATKLIPTYDCMYITIGQYGSGSDFETIEVKEDKYIPTAVLGVSMDTVAAGNENTFITVNISKNGIKCNETPGIIEAFASNSGYKITPGVIYSGTLLLDDNLTGLP